MISKAEYLAFWGYEEGTPEAEEAWNNKVAFEAGKRVIYAPMVFVSQDVCYDSPIDGRHITNRQARIEDMKRSGCIEYDPGMRQDAERRRQESEAALDRSIEAQVEKDFHQLPSAKRERLANELLAGATAEPVRLTANGD